jgi:hypothetical protein
MGDLRDLLVWTIDETAGFDTAWARIEGTRLIAEGRAAGLLPVPFWTTYSLETGDDFVTARVQVESRWAGGSAALDLRRDGAGWTVNGERRHDLAGALDCDLAACLLTNTMPVLRHDLLASPGDHELTIAFIEIPALRVVPSRQRYTQVTPGRPSEAVVKFRSGAFESDLVFDADGFVLDYPQLGRRVIPDPTRTA